MKTLSFLLDFATTCLLGVLIGATMIVGLTAINVLSQWVAR